MSKVNLDFVCKKCACTFYEFDPYYNEYSCSSCGFTYPASEGVPIETRAANAGSKINPKSKYEFKNPRFYSKRPLSELKGIILLAPDGEAERIAKSKVFIGTIEDTVGAWMDEIKRPLQAIGHQATRELFRRANTGDQGVLQNIILTAVSASLKNTMNLFPPAPVDECHYITRAMGENEITGSCFLVVFVY